MMSLCVTVDTNLIQLDTDDMATNSNTYADNDDDLIFEVSTYILLLFLTMSHILVGFCQTKIERGD